MLLPLLCCQISRPTGQMTELWGLRLGPSWRKLQQRAWASSLCHPTCSEQGQKAQQLLSATYTSTIKCCH